MDKRTVLALILIGVIIFFWDDYYKIVYPPPPPSPADTLQAEMPQREPAPRRDTYIAPVPSSEQPPTLGDAIVTQVELPERRVTVETEDIRVYLSTSGARVTGLTIKPNRRYFKKEIELLNDSPDANIGAMFWTMEGPLYTSRQKFSLSHHTEGDVDIIVPKGGSREVVFQTILAGGRTLEVVYTFSGDGFVFTYDVGLRGGGELWVRESAEVSWRGGLAYTEPDVDQDVYYSNAYVYFTGDVLERQKLNAKKSVPPSDLSGDAIWGLVRTKYFTAALIPETGRARGAWMESRHDSLNLSKHHPNLLGVGLQIPIEGGGLATPVKVYVGPLDDAVLNQVEPTLKKAMTWGAGIPGLDAIIRPISKGVLWTLKAMYALIPNYGWCIILFSILVKIIIWPLTKKSYQSMAAMQRIQPRMQELRERFKGDPQRLNKEMMDLYKREGVNPLGGCMPILLQMPLLYALFIVFRSTIEFRRAEFLLWIKDLSLPDTIMRLPFSIPLYGDHVALLPIVMGVTTFFQSKQTMSDPNQKFMLYLMPVFLTLIFNQFPSGLTMYYTLFNVWTIIQQKFTPPPTPAAVSEAPENGRQPKRKKREK